jgi:L-amino acid N-acyltransferase YncA
MKKLRLARAADARAVQEIYGPIVADTVISFESEVPDEREMQTRIAEISAFAPWLVCEEDGRVSGYAYASRHRPRAAYAWCVDVSVYVRDGQRRTGVGRALYSVIFDLLRLQGFYAAHAGITLPNAASVGLHESLGFRRVGVYEKVGFKRGAWHDVGWWQLPLRERTGAPAPALTIEALQRHPGFSAALAVPFDAAG